MHSKLFSFNVAAIFNPAGHTGNLGKHWASLGVGWDSAQHACVYWAITPDPLSPIKTSGKHRSKARGWQMFSRGQIVTTVFVSRVVCPKDSVLPLQSRDRDHM